MAQVGSHGSTAGLRLPSGSLRSAPTSGSTWNGAFPMRTTSTTGGTFPSGLLLALRVTHQAFGVRRPLALACVPSDSTHMDRRHAPSPVASRCSNDLAAMHVPARDARNTATAAVEAVISFHVEPQRPEAPPPSAADRHHTPSVHRALPERADRGERTTQPAQPVSSGPSRSSSSPSSVP